MKRVFGLPRGLPRHAGCESLAHERDHTERARERAAVLDLHECACPLEASVGLHAPDRTHRSRDGLGNVLARARHDGDVGRGDVERSFEVGGAPGDVYVLMRAGCTRDRLSGLRDGLVRHAARVDNRNFGIVDLGMTVGQQALAHRLRVGVGDLAAEEPHGEGGHGLSSLERALAARRKRRLPSHRAHGVRPVPSPRPSARRARDTRT